MLCCGAANPSTQRRVTFHLPDGSQESCSDSGLGDPEPSSTASTTQPLPLSFPQEEYYEQTSPNSRTEGDGNSDPESSVLHHAAISLIPSPLLSHAVPKPASRGYSSDSPRWSSRGAAARPLRGACAGTSRQCSAREVSQLSASPRMQEQTRSSGLARSSGKQADRPVGLTRRVTKGRQMLSRGMSQCLREGSGWCRWAYRCRGDGGVREREEVATLEAH
ncbi:unnamed protein product [Pleuronectes platessa]|uniref:Uncharacterized protein n=1 Tax=Pleuronectes platessa TaxID=8262 RepID=A0A9N7YNE4_PLEPL|nr:unnamed protein product [Pleuronectes platessa]